MVPIIPIKFGTIHEYFSLHTKSRAQKLCSAMCTINLDGKSIEEYLCKIKGYVDELAGMGVPVRHEEYVDALLEGLPFDYAPVISVIESKKRTPSIAEIKALLYGHETRLTRYNQDAQTINSASLNYTQGYSHPNTYKNGGSQDSYSHGGGCGTFYDQSIGRGGGGPGRGSSGGRFANFQCQICFKYGYTANACHFKTDVSFQPHDSLTFFDPSML